MSFVTGGSPESQYVTTTHIHSEVLHHRAACSTSSHWEFDNLHWYSKKCYIGVTAIFLCQTDECVKPPFHKCSSINFPAVHAMNQSGRPASAAQRMVRHRKCLTVPKTVMWGKRLNQWNVILVVLVQKAFFRQIIFCSSSCVGRPWWVILIGLSCAFWESRWTFALKSDACRERIN